MSIASDGGDSTVWLILILSPLASWIAVAIFQVLTALRRGTEPTEPLCRGMRVEMLGLAARADLNGREAEVLQWNEARERWTVRLVGGVAERLLVVRRENLVRRGPVFDLLPEDVLVSLLEVVCLHTLEGAVPLVSHQMRRAVSGTWKGAEWRELREFAGKRTRFGRRMDIFLRTVQTEAIHLLRPMLHFMRATRVDAGPTMIHLATQKPAVLRLLVTEFGADVNVRRDDGSTPLIDVCCSPKPVAAECARILCEHGCDLYAVDDDGGSALWYATVAKNDACVQVLREFGVRGRPTSAPHLSSARVSDHFIVTTARGDQLPPSIRAELSRGDYTHWRPGGAPDGWD